VLPAAFISKRLKSQAANVRVPDMSRGRTETDYQPVTRARRRERLRDSEGTAEEVAPWPVKARTALTDDNGRTVDEIAPSETIRKRISTGLLKRGHVLTYTALFLFTIILYARPSEFYPSPLTNSLAFIVGLITIAIFIPSQLTLEGNLTARPREVNLVLLFCLTGLLSIPLALSPGEAWASFSDTFIRCIVIFIVMVNVVRTQARLKGLLFLALAVSIWLSVGAINDYRLGLMTVEGYRAAGRGSGIFGNSNDMALHLATIVPIAVALFFGSRRIAGKIIYGTCAASMIAAIVLTYSRGGFIGLMVIFIFMAWKLGRNHKFGVLAVVIVLTLGILLLAPGNYGLRILSIFIPSLDPVGSSESRRGELIRSLQVALRHPLFGIGMGNYSSEMSYTGLATHNSFTQVAAEIGMAGFVLYTMFIVTPLKRLGQIVRETFSERRESRYYYLSIGLQASLLAYMVTSFFASVAYLWYIYYLVAYAVCLRRMYEAETGEAVVLEKQKIKERKRKERRVASLMDDESKALTI
jgi:putative inorganic carbon (HCO3(-)) transporter